MRSVGRKDVCLFVEYDDVMNTWIPALSSSSSSTASKEEALSRLCQVWDKYLECPTLLDPYLSAMVTTLAHASLDSPKEEERERMMIAIYTLSKVRGRKQVQRYLPQDVFHLESIVSFLTNSSPRRWECDYVWLLWLGQLSLIPFPISTLDSSLETIFQICQNHLHHAGPLRDVSSSTYALWLSRTATTTTVDRDDNILTHFFTTLQQQLDSYYNNTNNRSSEVQCRLMGWIQVCAVLFQRIVDRSSITQYITSPFWTTLLHALEHETSSVLLQKLYCKVLTRIGCSYLPPRIAPWRYQRGHRSLVQNLNKQQSPLPQTVTSPTKEEEKNMTKNHNNGSDDTNNISDDCEENDIWYVAEEVEDVMDALLRKGLCHEATIVRWSAAKGIGRLTERLPSICAQDVVDGLLDLHYHNSSTSSTSSSSQHGVCLALAELARRGLLLPSQLSDVISNIVLPALLYDVPKKGAASVRDAACYTCWAFARAYSPSDLLPFIPQVSQFMILLCLLDREVNCRRAASAAIQEWVGRLGHIPFGIDILTTADYVSLGNRTDSYTTLTWSIAKYQPYTLPLLQHLLTYKYQHWDPAIRILTSQSLPPIINILLSQKDQNNMSYIVDTILLQQMIPRCTNMEEHVHSRHGALLAVAEITLALSTSTEGNINWTEYKVLVDSLANLVSSVEQKRLYRGKGGGEWIRAACLRLLECTALANIPLTVKQQVRYLDSIDASLSYPNIPHQTAACAALKALLTNYFPTTGGPSERLQQRIIGKYTTIVSTDENVSATRGFALALGQLPKRIFTPQNLDTTLDCLCQTAHPTQQTTEEEEGDADTRTHALQSIISLCQTFQQTSSSSSTKIFLTKTQWDQVFQTLLTSMNDYNMDRRGDVGSWCRIEAMKGLVTLVPLAIQSNMTQSVDKVWNKELCIRIIGAFFKQLAEKLDTVREEAGTSLEQLLLSSKNCDIPFIPNKQGLLQALELQDREQTIEEKNYTTTINWSDSNVTFPLVMCVMDISSEFFEYILSGMVISVGGLTERVQKSSTTALLNWFRKQQQKQEDSKPTLLKFINTIIKLFQKHSKDGRVILPLLKTCDIVLSRGCLDSIIVHDDESSTFISRQLLTCLKTEAHRCTDVIRLLQMFIVALGLLRCKSKSFIQDELSPFLLKFLVHNYPRVRRGCAEQLYVKLVEDFSSIFDAEQSQQDQVLDRLSVTVWDDNKTNKYRQARNEIADLLSIPLPEKERLGLSSTSSSNQKKTDEFKSYASLVHEAGR